MSEHAHASQTTVAQQPSVAEEQASFGTTPLLPNGVFDTLHQSIGNRALGRMIESQHRASAESVTRITPWQQQQIEVIRRGGSDLPGAPGVRVHNDSNAAAMASTLRARAFTQGNDVFFGHGIYPPASEAGRNTLAHELTHISEGRAVSGTVQKDDEPNASVPPSDSSQPQAEETYTINLSTGTMSSLSEEAARNVLYHNASQLASVISLYKSEHQSVYDLRHQGVFLALGAALTDLAGATIPEVSIWVEPESKLAEAEANIGGGDMTNAAAGLKDANDAYVKAAEEWSKYKEQLDSAAYKAIVGVIVVAVVVAVVVVAALPAAAAGGAGAAGGGAGTAGGAAAGGAVVGGGATAGGAATAATLPGTAAVGAAATIPVDVAAAGAAATVPGSAAAAAGAASTIPAAVAIEGAGSAMAGNVVAAQGLAALSAGGEAAAVAVLEAAPVGVLEATYGQLSILVTANAPFLTAEMQALRRLTDLVFEVWKRKAGFPMSP